MTKSRVAAMIAVAILLVVIRFTVFKDPLHPSWDDFLKGIASGLGLCLVVFALPHERRRRARVARGLRD